MVKTKRATNKATTRLRGSESGERAEKEKKGNAWGEGVARRNCRQFQGCSSNPEKGPISMRAWLVSKSREEKSRKVEGTGKGRREAVPTFVAEANCRRRVNTGRETDKEAEKKIEREGAWSEGEQKRDYAREKKAPSEPEARAQERLAAFSTLEKPGGSDEGKKGGRAEKGMRD